MIIDTEAVALAICKARAGCAAKDWEPTAEDLAPIDFWMAEAAIAEIGNRSDDVEAFAREAAFRLSAARQTNSLNSGWHDIEAQGRALFDA